MQIAIDTAKQAGVNNIEFKLCDVREVSSLNTAFDFAYGRWAVFFTPDPDKTLAGLYDTMAPGGVLASNYFKMRKMLTRHRRSCYNNNKKQ